MAQSAAAAERRVVPKAMLAASFLLHADLFSRSHRRHPSPLEMPSFRAIAPALLGVAAADYTNFFFSSNNSCPDLGIRCEAPESLCAYDGVVDKYYCCSGARYNICRAFAATCEGRNDGPSSSQQECNTSGTTWCCLQDSESCTQRTGNDLLHEEWEALD